MKRNAFVYISYCIVLFFLSIGCAFITPTAIDTNPITFQDLFKAEPGMDSAVYKTVGEVALKLYYLKPKDHTKKNVVPAVIWIHGGGWAGGNAATFFPHAKYYASRGAVGISIEYRLIKKGGPYIADCIADCKSAIRYIRKHAKELGIDPNKIIVMGDSAGGHLAAALATIDDCNDTTDDTTISTMPNAMVLYNPAVDLAVNGFIKNVQLKTGFDSTSQINTVGEERLALAKALSPTYHVHSNLPPTLVIHGLDDKVVLPEQAIHFTEQMKAAGNSANLILLPQTRHAFVVPKYTATEAVVVNAIKLGDSFIDSLHFLKGTPTLEVSTVPAWEIAKKKAN